MRRRRAQFCRGLCKRRQETNFNAYGNPSIQKVKDFLAMPKMVSQASFQSTWGIRSSMCRPQSAGRLTRSVVTGGTLERAYKH